MIVKLVLLLTLFACGVMERPQIVRTLANQEVDSRLLPYLEDFRKECKRFRKDCDTRIAAVQSLKVVKDFHHHPELSPMTVGVCHLRFPIAEIEIREDELNNSPRFIRAIIYHELAHCAYYTMHVEQNNTLISEYIPDFTVLNNQWSKLVAHLFQEIGVQYAD